MNKPKFEFSSHANAVRKSQEEIDKKHKEYMETKKSKKEAVDKTPVTSPTTALSDVLSEAEQLNKLNLAIWHVDAALTNLQEVYNTKAQNPISSVMISLELLKMNLTKLKPKQND